MLFGADGKPVHPVSDTLKAIYKRFIVPEELRQVKNEIVLGRMGGSVLGPDGKPVYNEAETREGYTVRVRLPKRFEK